MKANISVLKINGVEIACPKTIEVAVYDLDSEEGSGRNQNGEMVRDRKAVKRKVNCTFPPLSQADISRTLSAMQPVFFSLTYPDPIEGQKTINAYAGDRTTPIFIYDKYKSEWLWQGLSVNFIEQ